MKKLDKESTEKWSNPDNFTVKPISNSSSPKKSIAKLKKVQKNEG